MKTFPLTPFGLDRVKAMAQPLFALGQTLEPFFPNLQGELSQTELQIKRHEYISMALLTSSAYAIATLLITVLLGALYRNSQKVAEFSIIIALVVGVITFAYAITYPKLILRRRTNEMERHLLFVFRSTLIQIRSGVPLFNTLVTISDEDYGGISKEFKKAVKRINTGTNAALALDSLAENNPSTFFRRAIWQLSNSLRSGSDLSNAVSVIISDLSKEQLIQIKRYGAILNPLVLMFMIITIIVPALGSTFLIILSAMPTFGISEIHFAGLLLLVAVMQFMFIGLVKSLRPSMV